MHISYFIYCTIKITEDKFSYSNPTLFMNVLCPLNVATDYIHSPSNQTGTKLWMRRRTLQGGAVTGLNGNEIILANFILIKLFKILKQKINYERMQVHRSTRMNESIYDKCLHMIKQLVVWDGTRRGGVHTSKLSFSIDLYKAEHVYTASIVALLELTMSSIFMMLRTVSVASLMADAETRSGWTTFSSRMSVIVPCSAVDVNRTSKNFTLHTHVD